MPTSNQSKPFLIACLGDSHTKGNCGYDWVNLLREQWMRQSIEIENFGVNGELAYNARQRVLDVTACDPNVVLILLGTNDVNALANQPLTQRYIKKGRLPQKPDKAFFETHLNGIVDNILAACNSHIVLLTLPPLSEDLDGEANRMIDQYNCEIRSIADRRKLDLIDLNEAMKHELFERTEGRGRPLHQGIGLIARAMLKHYFLFRSWNAISHSHGLHLLTDTIHLNERSGRILVKLVKDHIEGMRNTLENCFER